MAILLWEMRYVGRVQWLKQEMLIKLGTDKISHNDVSKPVNGCDCKTLCWFLFQLSIPHFNSNG